MGKLGCEWLRRYRHEVPGWELWLLLLLLVMVISVATEAPMSPLPSVSSHSVRFEQDPYDIRWDRTETGRHLETGL